MEKSKLRFSDKVIWISGAAQGIGRGIAEYFAKEGAMVALIDLKKKEGRNVENEINNSGGIAKFFFCDLNEEMAIKKSIKQVVQQFGNLHVLVNNAAVNLVKALHDCSCDEWDWQMNINLRACFLSFKYAYPYLKKHDSSYIVNIGSISGFVAQALTPGYVASKGAINMLTKAIAIDYAVDGIRCNVVCPGITDTPMLMNHMGKEVLIQDRLKRVPMGRILKTIEIARAVAYLSCEDSSGITGTTITIDGGYLATAEWNGKGGEKL